MKRFYQLALGAVISLVLASCVPTTQPEYHLSNLQGLWLEDNTEHYVRFTTEQSDETPYLYGREWDEAEDISEADLYVYVKDSLGADSLVYGNGWFKYWLETSGSLTEIHLMENGGAEIPKVYILTALTDTQLAYYEKDQKNIKFSFSKVVSAK